MKFLLIQLYQTGDVALTTHMPREIKRNHPDAVIDFLTFTGNKPVLENNPYINGILTTDRKSGFMGMVKTIMKIRGNRYDAVLDFHNNPRSAYMTFFSGAKYKTGYATSPRRLFYNTLCDRIDGRPGETKMSLLTPFEKNFDFPLKSTAKPIALPEIFYDLDKYSLRPESKTALDGLIKVLDDNPTITIKLTAHTDFRADDNYNLKLSNNRALAAYNYLVSKGVDKARLSWEGRGEKDPKEVENDQNYLPFKRGDVLSEQFINNLPTDELKEKAHQYNRRTEFRVLSTDYVPKTKK